MSWFKFEDDAMSIAVRNIFRAVPVKVVMQEQLFEAERLYVEHQAAAELHIGLAGVYKVRIARLHTALAALAPAALRTIK